MGNTRYARYTPRDTPNYYRWLFDPATAGVELAHNYEDHPGKVRMHSDLAADFQIKDGYHGYAFRLAGGWRICDWDFQPVADPFMVTRIIQSIKAKEGAEVQQPEQPEALPQELERTHHGIPLPASPDQGIGAPA